jgi:hypothetical protein
MHAYSDTDLAFLVFQCGASGRSTLTSGRTGGPDSSPLESGWGWNQHVWTGPDGVRTRAVIIVRTVFLNRPNARNHSTPFRGSERPDIINPPSGRGPHSGYKMPRSPISLHTPQNQNFWLLVSKVGFKFLAFCIYLSYFRYSSSLFLFSFL